MTTDIPSNLQVLAELAIALVGFMGIVGALRARSGEQFTHRERLHTALLLLSSVIVLLPALVPSWLTSLADSEQELWRWSAWVLLVTHIMSWAVFVPLLVQAKAHLPEFPMVERLILFILVAIGAVAVVAEVLAISGPLQEQTAFVYEGVLLFFLSVGVFNFFSLILGPRG